MKLYIGSLEKNTLPEFALFLNSAIITTQPFTH